MEQISQYIHTQQQAAEQNKRWKELSEKMQSHENKLGYLINQASADQMLPKADFRGLNFDELLGTCLN